MRFCKSALSLAIVVLVASSLPADELPIEITRWLGPQNWQRDVDGPVISLGKPGEFDDTHIFAPCVANVDRVANTEAMYLLWYPGSRGTVAKRIFRLGLATSQDGKHFQKHPQIPVLEAGEDLSIVTPTLLKNDDGTTLKEDGCFRMWLVTVDFSSKDQLHTLRQTTSADGIHWEKISQPLLDHVYAPTILKDGDTYRMWYTDVSAEPWIFHHASSTNGLDWQVDSEPVLTLDQNWEQGRLFYPAVIKIDGVYLMWYGSYWRQQKNKTALGMAASSDGLTWHKSPHNPVFRPDPKRSWESHYTTSQCLMRLGDGSFRIWYSSRTKPPFVNKYFAIGTARWQGPGQ